jgi:hypothetical protein
MRLRESGSAFSSSFWNLGFSPQYLSNTSKLLPALSALTCFQGPVPTGA